MELMTITDVMSYLQVSRHYVEWIRDFKLLKMWKIGNKWRTTKTDIDDFIELTRGYDLSGKGDIITFAITHKLFKL